MSETPGDERRAVKCLLIREDGTRWTVVSLELSRRRFRVTARRRQGGGEEERDRLTSEPLTPKDELLWLDEDGDEVARVRGADS